MSGCVSHGVVCKLENFSQGSSGGTDIENRLVDTVREGEGGMNWEGGMETCTLPYLKQIATGNWRCTQGVQPRAPWQPGRVGCGGRWWVGGSRGKVHRYTCDWFMLTCGRNQHNTVKQLSSNKNLKTTQTPNCENPSFQVLPLFDRKYFFIFWRARVGVNALCLVHKDLFDLEINHCRNSPSFACYPFIKRGLSCWARESVSGALLNPADPPIVFSGKVDPFNTSATCLQK